MINFYNDIWNQVFKHTIANYNESKYLNLTKELLRIEPYKIKGFLRRHIGYKTPTNIYLDPYEYKIFNWVKEEKFPVIMLDASFNDKRFVTFYHNWCEENNYSVYRNGNLGINVYTSDIRKPEISITHVNPNSKFFHPKKSLEILKNPTYKKYYSGLQEAMKKIKNAGYSVAIATNNKTEKMCFRGRGILTMHYNNLRGLNVAENVDYFFVFETPQQPVKSKFYHSEK
ncbi:MAG: hypothetical protein K8E24_013745, partial [Methanobacterium paludis]|nr:hypothetical protein [Methanobacterium paludis]